MVPDARALSRQIENTFTRMFRVLIDQNSQRRSDLSAITRQMDLTLPDTQTMRRRVDDVARVAQSACVRYVSERKIEVKGLDSLLKTLDPFSTIKRGFAIVQLPESGKIVSSTSHIVEGDSLEIFVADGSIPAVVARATNINTIDEKRTSKRDFPLDLELISKPIPLEWRLFYSNAFLRTLVHTGMLIPGRKCHHLLQSRRL
ncbi:MAG: hypothetical protein Ct9H300mP11_16580 [Chloroflexota bacterium]|nr:MAG: hypothetical protein Ct9H300mP11_16580 [Chloroflexota bacterium]